MKININEIQTLHEVNDTEKLEFIKKSMVVNGWNERPILVIDRENEGYQALTGTHRINAAKEIGIEEIPCKVITSQLFETICSECQWDLDMIMRDLDGFIIDLKDYDVELYNLLREDV